MVIVVIRFDLRVPSFAQTTHAQQYQACLDQVAWADANGVGAVVLSEHHGVDDGYMCAPLTIAAAIAGATKRIQINIAAALVPLHDPVRMAEQLATLDLLSHGRVGFVAGLGYRPEEFEMAGIDRSQRGKLMEEYITVMRQAWTGEPFEWRGRTIRVTPRPQWGPMVLIGGSTPGAARRAARLRAGFFPSIGDPQLSEVYDAECARLGFTGGFAMMPGGPGFVHVSENPDRDWERLGPHIIYDAQTYAAWQTPGQRSVMHVDAASIAEVRKGDVYKIVTPEECIALAKQYGRIVLHPLMGGISPEIGWEGLRLFEKKVLPHIQ